MNPVYVATQMVVT